MRVFVIIQPGHILLHLYRLTYPKDRVLLSTICSERTFDPP